MMDDYDGQMIFGDLVGLKLPDIRLTGEEKPRKNLTQETCPDRELNPGPLRDKRACNHLFHSGGQRVWRFFFTLLHVQICLGVHPASCKMNTGVSPRVKLEKHRAIHSTSSKCHGCKVDPCIHIPHRPSCPVMGIPLS